MLAGFGGQVIGLPPTTHLRQVIANDLPDLDPALAEAEILQLVDELCAEYRVRALLLECTNLPPYKAAIKARFGLEVFDILTLINDVNIDLVKPEFV